jgi:transcriptional regulator of NAD metabolism
LTSNERRDKILSLLRMGGRPVTGNEFADMFSVTRQVIVKDIAIIKAEGVEIISTHAGYKIKSNKNIKMIAVKHSKNQIRTELEAIVNNGGKVLDITVEHPIYGELTGNLGLETQVDIEIFMAKIKNSKPLAIINDGLHLHRIEVDSEEDFLKIKQKLDELGLLVK